MDSKAMYSITYGLYVLSARTNEGVDNACIINTLSQLTSNPLQVSVTVNKANYTHDIIKNTGIFNVSVLSKEAPFMLFKQFGFRSGRNTDKFIGFTNTKRAANGVLYLPSFTCSYISGKIINEVDCGSHTIFVASVEDSEVLGCKVPMTYDYYFKNVKQNPVKEVSNTSKGFVCDICGYVYEGETLPEDFVCPICKHGKEAFKKL